MALIKCGECGKEFSDKASACPNCACPVEREKVKVIVEREKGFLGSANVPVIYIDDKLIGNLKTGTTLETETTMGEHNFIMEYQVGNAQKTGILALTGGYGSSSVPQKKIVEKFVVNENTNVIKIEISKVLQIKSISQN